MVKLRVPSDVVEATLHYVEKKRFPADVPKIHKVFHIISKDTEISDLFSDFTFDTTKSYPHCQTIRFALDRLQKSNLLACINPRLDEFEITDKLGKANRDVEELFDEPEKQLLKKAAGLFEKEIA